MELLLGHKLCRGALNVKLDLVVGIPSSRRVAVFFWVDDGVLCLVKVSVFTIFIFYLLLFARGSEILFRKIRVIILFVSAIMHIGIDLFLVQGRQVDGCKW